jgi:3-oxoadipate enol-lactonase
VTIRSRQRFCAKATCSKNAEGYVQACEALAQAEKTGHRLIGCLVVAGEDDAIAPPSVARELAGKIRGAKTVILRRCGRWTPIEKVKECGQLLSDFRRGIPI